MEQNRLIYIGTGNAKSPFIGKIRINTDWNTIQDNEILFINDNFIERLASVNNLEWKYIILWHQAQNFIEKDLLSNNLMWVNYFYPTNDISFLEEWDIVEIQPAQTNQRLMILYRIGTDDNLMIPTNDCNSSCIMCPLPLSHNKSDWLSLKKIERILSLMDKTTKHLSISWWEPTLLKQDFIKILSLCKSYIPNTSISILSNGRTFSYSSLVDAINSVWIKNIDFCIPLHAHIAEIHDGITKVKWSFDQTIQGIKNLLSKWQNIELRIVIQKDNYMFLEDIADFIWDNFNGLYRVSFIGMEFLWSAIINKDRVWVPYSDFKHNMQNAIMKLLKKKIWAYVFNVPLCFVDPPFRDFCLQSISKYKIKYFNVCDECIMRSSCWWVFQSSYYMLEKENIIPIKD